MIYLIFILQLVCIAAVGYGIYVEYTLAADLGYLLISAGSLIFALTTKLTKIKMFRIISYLTKQMEDKNHD